MSMDVELHVTNQIVCISCSRFYEEESGRFNQGACIRVECMPSTNKAKEQFILILRDYEYTRLGFIVHELH